MVNPDKYITQDGESGARLHIYNKIESTKNIFLSNIFLDAYTNPKV
jgi:hypothetical protein